MKSGLCSHLVNTSVYVTMAFTINIAFIALNGYKDHGH